MKKTAKKPAVKRAAKPAIKPLAPHVVEVADVCARCRFIAPESDTQGRCRRYPPSAAMMMQGGVVSFHPPVEYGAWCGEFKVKA